LSGRRRPARPHGAPDTAAAGLSPRAVAIEILLRVEQAGAYASVLLDHREPRFGDGRDAALLHELVLGVLRRRATLDAVVAACASRPPERMDPAVRAALRLGAYELLYLDRVPAFASVNNAVELTKRAGRRAAAGFVNGILRAVASRGRELLPDPPQRGDLPGLALFHSQPEWWVRRQVDRLDWDAAVELLEAHDRPVRTVLCVNRRRTDAAQLVRQLEDEGVSTEPGRYLPEALRVVRGRLRGSRLAARGLFWVQDEASQLVARMFGQPIGPRVADLCAAPGAKSLQLAELVGPGGWVLAADRHLGRLRRLQGNAVRVGADHVLALNADMAREPVLPRGSFEQVLVDAPCSGTGTLRRHPEIRWRLEPSDLKRLARRQRQLLETAAALVVPGGEVVYSVCSLEPEEGEEVVDAFLRSRPEFRLVDPREALPPRARDLVDGRGILRTSPAAGGLDGFFAARLRLSYNAPPF
jgi:16S rRNA (cytosine967-C5)-methyltransferase